MSFDEEDLRKALDARSGEVTSEFRARLKQSLAEVSRPQSGWMPALAVATAIALTVTSIGVLVAARHFIGPRGSAASRTRVTTPTAPGTIQVSAPSPNVVWILVDRGHLYRSMDRGDKWEERQMPPSFGVRPSISFISDTEGWLLAPEPPTTQCQDALAAVWHTHDAGATWQQLRVAGIPTAQCKELIHFSDAGDGFISAWDASHQPTVYWSSDGGVGWKRATLPDPPDFKTLPGGFSLRVEWIKAFGNTFYLEAYGIQGPGTPYPDLRDRQYIYTSTNGGGTWGWKEKVGSRDLALVTETRWLEIVAPNRMDESVNAGQQFHPFESNLARDISAGTTQLVFADASVGYAAAGPSLQRTVNGGSHWTRISLPGESAGIQPTPSPPDIRLPTTTQLSAPSSNAVWALVQSGYLFRSMDQGATWQQRNSPPYGGGGGNPVISFIDDTRGWALFPGVPATQCLQAGAELWQTTDGAATWHILATVADQKPLPDLLTFDQCKDYVTFVDSTHGFVASHDTMHQPIISRTADDGVTWAQSTLPDPTGFTATGGHALHVVQIKNFEGVMLAEAGLGDGTAYMFRSADGGVTWSYAATVPGAGVAFVTATRWIQLIVPGQTLETTDAGKSWHGFASDYSQAAPVAPQVVFGDALVGYATVRGSIQRTVDGGLHWTPIQTPGVKQPG